MSYTKRRNKFLITSVCVSVAVGRSKMYWPLLFFIGYFCAVHAVPLPPDLPVDYDDYTVLYKGPSGSHYQSGEPGKNVKGIYTFLDSNGRKQQVTYEADARGYRVKTVAADTQNSGLQVPEIKTEIKSVRVVIRTNAQQELKDQKLEAPKGKIKQDSERGIDSEKPVAEIVPDRQKEPFPAPEELAKIRPEKPVAELVLDPQKEPFPVPEELAKILPEKPVATIVPDRQKEPFPVSEELAKILPESLPGLRPNEEAALVPNSNGQKPAPQGTIKFKDPRSAQLSDELGYFIGYPFTQGNYVYAL